MKTLGIILLVVVAIAAVAGMGDSDDTSSSSPKVEHVTAADVVDSDASRGLELTDEGQEISARIVEWSQRGADGDLVGACAEVDVTKADVARMHEIVDELATLDVPQSTVRELRLNGQTLEQQLSTISQGCANLGY